MPRHSKGKKGKRHIKGDKGSRQSQSNKAWKNSKTKIPDFKPKQTTRKKPMKTSTAKQTNNSQSKSKTFIHHNPKIISRKQIHHHGRLVSRISLARTMSEKTEFLVRQRNLKRADARIQAIKEEFGIQTANKYVEFMGDPTIQRKKNFLLFFTLVDIEHLQDRGKNNAS